jgi:phage/plasmid-like protein (TIGR03299 family)
MLVRDSDERIFGPAGKDYVPTQNEEVFSFFDRFTKAGQMTMDTAGALGKGQQVWALASMNKGFSLGEDNVQGYLLFNHPHVWGKALTIKFTTIRVVCANTLAMAMSEKNGVYGNAFRAPHIRAFDESVQKEAISTLGLAVEMLTDMRNKAHILSRARVTPEVQVKFIADVFQPDLIKEAYGKSFYKLPVKNQIDALVDPKGPEVSVQAFKRSAYDILSSINRCPGANFDSAANTLWGVFNGVTYYYDHASGNSRDTAMTSAWMGPKAAMKINAMERALQFAPAL